MALKVGINGFGRIGRNFVRAHVDRGGKFDIVAVNDLAAPDVLAHLLRYDSSHGRLSGVEVDGDEISVNGSSFQVLGERDPKACPGPTSASTSSSSRPGSSPRATEPSNTCRPVRRRC